MADILLKDLLNLGEVKRYKLHAARYNTECEPLDVFVENPGAWLKWNQWRNEKNEFNRTFILALIDYYPERHTWLFGGIFEVIGRDPIPKTYGYQIKELEQFQPYVGRLKVHLKLTRGRAFLLENYIDQMVVKEIMRKPYSGEVFPGLEHINHPFHILEPIFKNGNPDWKSPLSNLHGVYAISDASNGKHYVGAAYGDDGIWSRWKNYMTNGHGGNVHLKKLMKANRLAHARQNYQFTLLEHHPANTPKNVVLNRESYWKGVFQSAKFGYN